APLQGARPFLMLLALDGASLQMAYAGERPGNDYGGQRRCEDEARRATADGVAAGTAGGDVSAHHAKAFGECAVDDVHPVEHAVALRDAAAPRAIKADGV